MKKRRRWKKEGKGEYKEGEEKEEDEEETKKK